MGRRREAEEEEEEGLRGLTADAFAAEDRGWLVSRCGTKLRLGLNSNLFKKWMNLQEWGGWRGDRRASEVSSTTWRYPDGTAGGLRSCSSCSGGSSSSGGWLHALSTLLTQTAGTVCWSATTAPQQDDGEPSLAARPGSLHAEPTRHLGKFCKGGCCGFLTHTHAPNISPSASFSCRLRWGRSCRTMGARIWTFPNCWTASCWTTSWCKCESLHASFVLVNCVSD